MKYSRTSIAAVSIAGVLVLVGCGQDASNSTGAAGRVIDIDMTDNAYAPSDLQMTKGETVTFRFHNNGVAVHEAVIGDAAFQAEHHEEMTSGSTMGNTMTTMDMEHGGMDSSGSGSDEIVVQPGQMAEMEHTFTDSGTVLIGCHEPGHWEAGMKATVTVR